MDEAAGRPPGKGVARWRVEAALVLATLLGSVLVWLPYWSRMGTVYRFWDGPNYLFVAKSLYALDTGNPLLAYVYDPKYYLVHLPVYPLLVRLFSFIGWQRALLVVSVGMAAAAAILFYRLARDVWRLPSPGWLAFVFLFLPPRWVLYRSVGASESTYLALLLASLFLFEKGRTGRAALLGGLATLTRIPGLMLAPAYLVILAQKKRWREVPWLLLVGLPLAGYFAFCALKTGSFFEYFAIHSDKTATLVPFAFVSHFFKQGLYHQVEFYILLGLVYAVGVGRIRDLEVPFAYSFFEILLLIFMATEEWSRYFLVIAPTALIAGYRDILVSKAFRWVFPVAILMSFVYAWGTLPLNGCRPDIYGHLLYHLGILREFTP